MQTQRPFTHWLSAVVAIVILVASIAPCAAQVVRPRLVFHRQTFDVNQGQLTVMNYNINEGTDYLEVEQAQTQTQFLVAVGQTISQVRATNSPLRMQAIAQQIAAARPTLVSLEEVDKWYSGSFNPATGTCGAVSLEFDMLAELLAALSAQGTPYQIANQVQQFAFPPTPGLILPSSFLCVSVVNTNVILARADLNPAVFSYGNAQSGQFVNRVFLPTPLGNLPIPRAWDAVDALFHGQMVRFVGTHLEPNSAAIRELQGAELRNGPANALFPVVIAMDSNAQAAPLPQDPTYIDFINAGYADVWSQLFPTLAGFTCCQAELDNNPVSQLYQRVDLILTRGQMRAHAVELFGATPASKTSTGLWPSDHAGIVTQLTLGESE